MKQARILLHAATLAILAALLGGAMAWAQAEGPSLAELARKKKKDDKQSTHVYSDENLPKAGADFGGSSTTGSGGASASGGSSQTPAPDGGTAPAAAAGEAKAGEPAPDLAAAQEKVETAKQDEQSLKNNIKHLEDQLANETKPSRREMYQSALERARENLAEFTRRRESAEQEAAAAEAAGKKKSKKPAATAAPAEQPPQ